ncbi:armadillo repeat-containing protein 2 isoform X1 [Huso huso]|uniref:Armadillo repeat-containing protein 2 isoform X1 n=1 Tax=Huso huso TaxID=61971 RepID=A0ABR0ZX03_HUSHU
MEKKAEISKPFYVSSAPKQKTSAEIISEARKSLRTLKTQRPLTPREDQRKLFGPSSSRTPENRPPSAFSLHALNFDVPDSRPVTVKRLTPLEHIPKLPSSPDNEVDTSPPLPKPPVDPVEVKRVSSARARLFKAASQGGLPPVIRPEEFMKRLNSEPSLAKPSPPQAAQKNVFSKGQFRGSSPLLTEPTKADENEKEVFSKKACENSVSSRPGSGSDSIGSPSRTSSRPSSSESTGARNRTGTGNESRTQEVETEEETCYWNAKIIPILQQLESTQNGNDVEYLCGTCVRLYGALEQGNMLERKCKKRASLLKALYRLIDIGSDQLSLQLAKLILALSVTGKNLLNVCKLIFKISRSENNDFLFENNSITDSLLSVVCTEDVFSISEALLYCMGALKFLSGNSTILKELLNKGLVEILLQLMKKINDANKLNKTHFSISGHLLVQLTATLRNSVDQSRQRFLCSEALPELCVVLEQHGSDKDICTNIARIFSKLSSYNDCCAALANCSGCYQLFLALLKKHQKKQDFVVRIFFTLGNLTAKNNNAREQFFKEEGSIDDVLELFRVYYELDITSKASKTHPRVEEERECVQTHTSEVEDVLIKLIRLLANLSIHPTVGTALATNPICVGLLVKVLEYKSIDECEELVINAAATINNLSFYPVRNSVVRARQLHLAELLVKLLLSNNMEGILEAARVFGNLSQSKEVRDFIVQKNVYKFMVALLDAKNQDVCFSACGVLINLTVDKNKRVILREEGGIKKLIDCLRDFGPTDWQLASLVCKTLWNYSEKMTCAALSFGEEETKALLHILSTYLEEDLALDCSSSEDLREFHKVCWETEFIPVAQQLMNRIQRHDTFLEPLTAPS